MLTNKQSAILSNSTTFRCFGSSLHHIVLLSGEIKLLFEEQSTLFENIIRNSYCDSLYLVLKILNIFKLF